ncbi:MAG: TMEM175 family protein [Bacteroidota bacterium]
MIRSIFEDNRIGMNKDFRFRGQNQTRLETFSDAVFALSITLLIVSSSVPESFDDMVKVFADFIPFALCMALITYIWYEHFLFFIRFGFRNTKIVLLNAILLFLILFFVYPLKFLSKMLVGIYVRPLIAGFGGNVDWILGPRDMISSVTEMSTVLIVYGLFGTSIFGLMALMYRYALKQKEELALNELEVFDSRTSQRSLIIMSGVPMFSVVLALIFSNSLLGGILSGFSYMLYIPLFIYFGKKAKKQRAVLSEKIKDTEKNQLLAAQKPKKAHNDSEG